VPLRVGQHRQRPVRHRLEEVRDGGHGELGLGFRRPARQDTETALRRAPGDLAPDGRLADSGSSLQEQQPHAIAGGIDECVRRGELGGPPEHSCHGKQSV
jgi:hypothetical protein